MNKEVEVKFEIHKDVFLRLVSGTSGFSFERTYGFFMPAYENIQKGIFPRIKHVIDAQKREFAHVTVKVKPKGEGDDNLFVREEHEFIVGDIDELKVSNMRGMFSALGYPLEHIFEKRRYELGRIHDCACVVDELPFGYFVEIEGDPADIHKAVTALELDEYPRINAAYLKLWEDYKRVHHVDGECIFE